MRRQQGTLYRGLYGPHPAAVIAPALLWRRRLAAWIAASRCALAFAAPASALEPAAAGERALDEARRLRFWPLVPAAVARGYRLAGAECIPHCTDLLTLVYDAGCGKSFRLSQRQKWLPLAEELRVARVPATPVRCGSVRMFVVHGVYTGEPIDHAYSARHRRSVAIELGETIAELREVIGQGPGLPGLIAMARGMAEQSRRAPPADGIAGEGLPADPLGASVRS